MLGRLLSRGRRPLAQSVRRLCSYPDPPELVPAEMMGPALRRRVASLESLHARLELLEEEQHEKLRQLEAEYMEQTRAIFERRQQIVSGVEEPTDDEVNASAYFSALMEADEQLVNYCAQ